MEAMDTSGTRPGARISVFYLIRRRWGAECCLGLIPSVLFVYTSAISTPLATSLHRHAVALNLSV
jgi:hypothetical protein